MVVAAQAASSGSGSATSRVSKINSQLLGLLAKASPLLKKFKLNWEAELERLSVPLLRGKFWFEPRCFQFSLPAMD